MNSLKPLLTVAILAGIGYGVYTRLNDGRDVPPPPVSESWDTTPSVHLPEPTDGAPWSSGPAAADRGSQAPPYRPPSVAAAEHEAPANGWKSDARQSSPSADGGAPAYEREPLAGSVQPNGNAYEYEYLPPHDSNGGQPPPGDVAATPDDSYRPSDPYAGGYESPDVPDRYRTPSADVPPASNDWPAYDDRPTPDHGPNGEPPSGDPAGDFAAAHASAKRELEGGQLVAALARLSQWYDHPQLSPSEQQQLRTLLDQVAGTVVYSTQNLLEPPYEVQPGERLEDIGEKHQVPWQLLAKINGIDDPSSLRPGERLKVVRGPFQAVISLDRRELTLLTADELYAGRFPIGIGAEHPPREGTFPVADKVVGPVYYGRDRAIAADDPENPLGGRWIDLGSNLGIHGTNHPENVGRTDLPGSISLSDRDIVDVFDILSVGSRVTIRR